MSVLGYSIKVVARLTGLTPHVIRVWEKRYQAVAPGRTKTNRRLYTDSEVERLALLRQATEAGHSIRNVATATTADLRRLVEARKSTGSPSAPSTSPATVRASAGERLASAMAAIQRLDAAELDRIIHQAAVDLSQPALLEELIAPLICGVGEQWETGKLKVVHEHLASAVVRSFLGSSLRRPAPDGYAPTLVVTTPAGQVHEMGAILAAAQAVNHGWRVCYLGPNLPAEEIAAAAIHHQARAVALSIVYPSDDPHLVGELTRLFQLLPETPVVVGGRASAAAAYQSVLKQMGAVPCPTIAELGAQLGRLRHRSRTRSSP